MSTVGDLFRYNVEGNLVSGDRAMMTRATRHASGSDVAEVTLADALAAKFSLAYDNIQGNQAIGVVWDTLRLFSINPGTGQMDEVAAVSIVGSAGTGLGDQLANQDAVLLRWRTDVPRRNGLNYFPGFTEAAQNADVVDAAVVAAILLFTADWMADTVVGGGTFEEGIWSRTTLTFFNIIDDAVATTIKSQRRRQTGIGI